MDKKKEEFCTEHGDSSGGTATGWRPNYKPGIEGSVNAVWITASFSCLHHLKCSLYPNMEGESWSLATDNCYVTHSWTHSWIQEFLATLGHFLHGHSICASISKTCALCISRAGALLVHKECTSLGNSWELPCLLLCQFLDFLKLFLTYCIHSTLYSCAPSCLFIPCISHDGAKWNFQLWYQVLFSNFSNGPGYEAIEDWAQYKPGYREKELSSTSFGHMKVFSRALRGHFQTIFLKISIIVTLSLGPPPPL